VRWFKDKFTGTQRDRLGLDKLLAEARAGKIPKVVCRRLDRLGRTARGLLALRDELQALGIGFVSLREGIDLATPAGRLMLVVPAGVSQYETEVQQGTPTRRHRQGQGRGRTLGPVQARHTHQAVGGEGSPDPPAYAEGKAVAAIARLVGLSRKSVYKALEPTRDVA
jgi:DNA invertase Pin-like site-specific DNA recombinase